MSFLIINVVENTQLKSVSLNTDVLSRMEQLIQIKVFKVSGNFWAQSCGPDSILL